jgi:hypothetical protein
MAIVALVCGGVGVVAGRGQRPSAAPAPPVREVVRAVPGESRVVVTPGAPGLDPEALQDDIRELLREELAERDGPDGDTAVEAAVAPTTDNLAAAERGQDVVASAIAAGHWTEADAIELRALALEMTQGQREEVAHTLVPAINRQELRLDYAGPPF